MNDPLHIHLPCGDADIEEIEKFLGIKFQRVVPETVPSEKVEVCPMSPPSKNGIFLDIYRKYYE